MSAEMRDGARRPPPDALPHRRLPWALGEGVVRLAHRPAAAPPASARGGIDG